MPEGFVNIAQMLAGVATCEVPVDEFAAMIEQLVKGHLVPEYEKEHS